MQLAARPQTECKEAFSKRLVYGLFVLPFSRVEATDLEQLNGRALRYREEVRLSDAGLSLLGFLVSIVTKTAVVEDCGPISELSPQRLAALEKAEKDANRLRDENQELKRLLSEDGPSARERKSAGTKSSNGGDSKAPPQLTLRSGDADQLAPEEQLRFVIGFAKNSSRLDKSATEKLDQIIRAMVGRENSRILVIGHMEYPGNTSAKLGLAYNRAASVANYIKASGVAQDRLLTASIKGPGWPYQANQTKEQHAMFLTVSVILVGPAQSP